MKIRRDMLPVGIIGALPLVLYAPFLFGKQVLYWGVYLLQFYPWRMLAVEQIRAGQWPLWNPYVGAGAPLAANLQTAAFYPPNVLFLLMPVERAFGWELALHIALAGIAAYALARVLGLSRFASLVAGLTYGGGGYLVARWLFPSMVYAAAWLPLMMALTERLARGPGSAAETPASGRQRARYGLLNSALLALTVGLQLLAGHAQTSFYSCLIVGAFALVRTAQHGARVHPNVRDRLRHAARSLGSTAMAAGWGVALAAIQLLPTAEFVAHSQRSSGRLSDLTFAYELSFWPWRLLTLVMPDLFGNPARDGYWGYGTYWEEAAFVGVLPLLLLVVAVAHWWRRRRARTEGPPSAAPFFLALLLVAVALALGNHTPLYPLLFRYVPGVGLFQAPARLMIGYALAVPMLAAMGADAFRPGRRSGGALRLLVVAGLGVGIGGAVSRWTLPEVRTSLTESILRLGVSVALAAAVLALRGRRLSAGRWQALAVAVVVVELLVFGWGLVPGSDDSVYKSEAATAQFLESQPEGRLLVMPDTARRTYDRFISLASFGASDLDHLQGLRESLLPNLNVIHGLAAVGNYDPLTVGLYDDLYALLEVGSKESSEEVDKLQPAVDLFGARYLLSDRELDLPLLRGGEANIYVNEHALPMAYVVYEARVVPDKGERMKEIQAPGFDPRQEVVLSRAPTDSLPPRLDPVPEAAIELTRPHPSLVRVEVEMADAGYLVLADTHYPGWNATIDGLASEILPANHAFRAVQLSKGQHTVVFEYAPVSFRLGLWLTIGAMAAWLVVISGCWALGRGR